jgi:hypothetical protein
MRVSLLWAGIASVFLPSLGPLGSWCTQDARAGSAALPLSVEKPRNWDLGPSLPYSSKLVEGVFCEVQGNSPKFVKKVTKKCAEALRDTYGDVPCLSPVTGIPGLVLAMQRC